MSPGALLLDILKRIKGYHASNPEDPIPTSDIMLRKVLGDLSLTRHELNNYLQLLADANHLFILRIVEADPASGEGELNGYVYADLSLINDLAQLYDKKLENLYEYEKYCRKDVLGIIRELVPQIRIYKHTGIGKLLNVSLMLKQFQHVMGGNYWQYKNNKKGAKLIEMIRENSHLFQNLPAKKVEAAENTEEKLVSENKPSAPNSSGKEVSDPEDFYEGTAQIPPVVPPPLPEADPAPIQVQEDEHHQPAPWKGEPTAPIHVHESANATQGSGRALDTSEYKRLQEMNLAGKWGVAVSTYGVQFLLRVHLRKYEFHIIRRLLVVRGVAREEDLKYIKTCVETMMNHLGREPGLRNYMEEMQELYNLTLQRLNILERAREREKKAVG